MSPRLQSFLMLPLDCKNMNSAWKASHGLFHQTNTIISARQAMHLFTSFACGRSYDLYVLIILKERNALQFFIWRRLGSRNKKQRSRKDGLWRAQECVNWWVKRVRPCAKNASGKHRVNRPTWSIILHGLQHIAFNLSVRIPLAQENNANDLPNFSLAFLQTSNSFTNRSI